MNISELQPGQGKVDIQLKIISIDEPRTFNKYGKEFRVANALVQDSSGQIKLSLWNDDISKVKAGQKIKIINGYVSEFKGEKQLSTGKYGSLEVLNPSSKDDSEDENFI